MDVANLVLLVIATIAAVVGAVFAYRADVFTRRSSGEAAAQREADIQPRLDAQWTGSLHYSGNIEITNAGGAATQFIWVGFADTSIFAAHGTCPAHAPSLLYRISQLGEGTFASAGTTLLVAEDIQGRWWDCRTGHVLTRSIEHYLTKRMEQVGLAEFTEGLIAASLRPPLPVDYVDQH